ncbi:hypothetical protein Tco_0193971 [Tanacetum coccineum]
MFNKRLFKFCKNISSHLNDDIIDEEDPIPHDLADSDDEDLVNLDIDDGVNVMSSRCCTGGGRGDDEQGDDEDDGEDGEDEDDS